MIWVGFCFPQRKKPNVSECARDTDGWRQFLEEHDTNEQEVEQQSNRGATLCLCASNFEQLSVCTSSKDDVPEESPEKESPKRESMYLLRAPEADEESTSSLIKVHGQGGEDESNSRISDIYSENSAESQGKFISCWESPAEWLDKASAEVSLQPNYFAILSVVRVTAAAVVGTISLLN